jgi:hypothetical protein
MGNVWLMLVPSSPPTITTTIDKKLQVSRKKFIFVLCGWHKRVGQRSVFQRFGIRGEI